MPGVPCSCMERTPASNPLLVPNLGQKATYNSGLLARKGHATLQKQPHTLLSLASDGLCLRGDVCAAAAARRCEKDE